MTVNNLANASRIAIIDCMGFKQGESILVLCDSNTSNIGKSLFETALNLTEKALLVEMKVGNINGEEPTEEIAELMKKFDIVLCPTTKSLTHTNARRNASAEGARIATFPGITEDVMIRGLSADYKKIADLTIRLCDLISKYSKIRVFTEKGTDVTMIIKGRPVHASKGLFHAKGESGNLPTGESYLAPIEGTTNGKIVVDGSFAGIGKLETPITIDIQDGYAVNFIGDTKADKLKEMLGSVGQDGFNVAEFGIGTNDKAQLSGIVLEDEKILGTIHIAFGDNKSMGGNVNVPIHLDGVILEPDVYLDDYLIMKKGKLLV